MLSSDTRAMGRFWDVVWYDLSITFAMGRLHSYLKIERRKSVPIIHLKEMIADVKKRKLAMG